MAAMLLCCGTGIVCHGQEGGEPSQISTSVAERSVKEHQFGFGISTALCDNMRGVNQYMYRGVDLDYEGVPKLTPSMYHSSFVAFYLDYQYAINNHLSLETRLKCKYRYAEMSVRYSKAGDIEGMDGSIGLSHIDLALPVTFNYRWETRQGSAVELFAGMGITTVGLAGRHTHDLHIDDMENYEGEIGLYRDRSVSTFGLAGIQIEVPFGVAVLKPFVSYSFGFGKCAHYGYSIASSVANASLKVDGMGIKTSELEAGLIVAF